MLRTKVMLQVMVAFVDGQVCCNFRGMVQCYGQTLHIVVTLCSNFLLLVTLSRTAFIKMRIHEQASNRATTQMFAALYL